MKELKSTAHISGYGTRCMIPALRNVEYNLFFVVRFIEYLHYRCYAKKFATSHPCRWLRRSVYSFVALLVNSLQIVKQVASCPGRDGPFHNIAQV